MLSRVKKFIKKRDKLYVLGRCIQNINDPGLTKLIRAWYDVNTDTIFMLEHPGNMLPDTVVYDISTVLYSLKEEDDPKKSIGLCAEMHHLLYKLIFAEEYGMIPRVVWGKASRYYDPGLDDVTGNVFEYYFEPVSETSKYSHSDFKNILRANTKHICKYQNMYTDSYSPSPDNIKMLAEAFKKYIVLNGYTKEFIDRGVERIAGKKVLGVHVRGTDFNKGFKKHPLVISLQDYLNKAKEIYDTGKYEIVFLATDDLNAIDMFTNEFSDKLVYYSDTFRTANDVGPHATPSGRPLHHYKLGLEVLRDVFTLANCDCLVCGLSHVSFAARYVNLSLDRKFDDVIVLSNGINY